MTQNKRMKYLLLTISFVFVVCDGLFSQDSLSMRKYTIGIDFLIPTDYNKVYPIDNSVFGYQKKFGYSFIISKNILRKNKRLRIEPDIQVTLFKTNEFSLVDNDSLISWMHRYSVCCSQSDVWTYKLNDSHLKLHLGLSIDWNITKYIGIYSSFFYGPVDFEMIKIFNTDNSIERVKELGLYFSDAYVKNGIVIAITDRFLFDANIFWEIKSQVQTWLTYMDFKYRFIGIGLRYRI